jgi:hypothetical protein
VSQPSVDVMRIAVREQRHPTSIIRAVAYSLADRTASLHYRITGECLPPPLAVYDFAVIAAIHVAMREGRPVHVEGPVTAALLRNVEEFQEIWSLWRKKYRRVPITADQVVPTEASDVRRGVFAVSGGVDGNYALLRHHAGHAGVRTVRPACAMLVHGFDIPLHEQQAFDHARDRIAAMTAALGIPLSIVETNWRDVLGLDWAMDCQASLASCLMQFRGVANVGVCGAAQDYGNVILPLGCNPVTNHLMSGGGFDVVTEGGCVTRTERVRFLCDYPEIAAQLRVCWEGPFTGGNCGRCEKCIRTKLNFMAVGSAPLCFDRPPTFAEILSIKARDPIQLHFLREILETATRNGIGDAWTTALRLTIAKNRIARLGRAAGRRIIGKRRSLSEAATSSTGEHCGLDRDLAGTPTAAKSG